MHTHTPYAVLVALGVFCLSLAAPAHAGEDEFSPAQEAAIREILRDYLVKNPAFVNDMLKKAQVFAEAQKVFQAKKAIADNAAALNAEGPGSVVIGNPKGDVTFVEFFDYRCPHCRTVFPRLIALVDKDPKFRLVLKEYPVFGAASDFAARAAIASQRQGKYRKFHTALLTTPGNLDEKKIFEIARKIGLNVPRLRRDMERADTKQALLDNRALGLKVGVRAVPNFIIGGALVSGSRSQAVLESFIAAERQKAKTARARHKN